MKIHRPHTTLVVGLAAISLAFGASFSLAGAQDPEDPTPLQEEMGGLQAGQRKLRRMLKDDSMLIETIELVQSMQKNAITAYGIPPTPPADVDAESHDGYRIGFQRGLLAVADCLLEMELALHEGDSDAANAAYKKLGELKKDGHDKYQ